jgi:hypothetical protein
MIDLSVELNSPAAAFATDGTVSRVVEDTPRDLGCQ